MKKIAYILLAAVVAFSSCKQLEFNYVPDNEDVSFSTTGESYSLEGQTIEIPIVRGLASEALSLAITLEDEDGLFTLDTPVVNFAANEFESKICVSYDLNEMAPAVKYGFAVSFDEKNMSVVGSNRFEATGMMPLDYQPYGEISVKYSMPASLYASKTYELQRAKFTTNYYRVKGIYASDVDFDFCVNSDGSCELLSTLSNNKYYSTYPMFMIPSGAKHPNYGQMTGYMDPDPAYITVTGAQADGTLVVGSIVDYDIFWTVSAGYFGWYDENLIVTKVN